MTTKFSVFLLVIFSCKTTFSQSDSLQQQINNQVWKPFIRSFSNMDTKSFMDVHSHDMTRVIQDGNTIYGYERYYHENEQGDKRNRQAGHKRSIELRFMQRIAANDKAFEVGYYKTTVTHADGKVSSGYGKFHVLLRRENGTWKILMDADASEKTDEAIFLTGKPME
jgi:ketosteroid isomerase-like protein